MRYEISQARAASMGLQQKDLSEQRQAAMTAARDAASNYFQQAGLDANAAEFAANQALQRGLATGQIDGTNTVEMNQYLADQAQDAATNTRADAQLRLDQEAAAKKGYQIVNADDGSIIAINPSDPSDNYVVGRYTTPKSSGPSTSDPYASPAGSPPSDAALALVDFVDSSYDPEGALTSLSASERAAYFSAKAYAAPSSAPTASSATSGDVYGPAAPTATTQAATSRYGGPQVPFFGAVSDYGNRAYDWLYGK